MITNIRVTRVCAHVRFLFSFVMLAMVVGVASSAPPAKAAGPPIYTLPFFGTNYISWCFECYPGHEGTDYVIGASGSGDNVVAALAGNAYTFDDQNIPGAGKHISMDHGNGNRTRYLHLQDWTVTSAGQFFSRGNVIGHEGSSGTSDNFVHLHFETRINAAGGNVDKSGAAVDPYAALMWTTNPPSYAGDWLSWQNWGSVWGQPQVTELATAVAHENPSVQSAHTAAARINRYGEGGGYNFEFREYTGTWTSWQDINTWPSAPLFDGKIGIDNHEGQINAVGIAQYNLWHRKRVSGSWNGWTNLVRPSVVNLNGPAAVSYSSGRIAIAAIGSGNVYFKKWQGSWSSWVSLGGSGTLGEAIAVATRPNVIYHVVSFRPSDHTVWVNCSTNGSTWTGWYSLGGMLDNTLGIDNSAATGCGTGSYPGVHMVAFSSAAAQSICWETYCSGWQNLGSMYTGATALANTNVQVSFVARNGLDMWRRSRDR